MAENEPTSRGFMTWFDSLLWLKAQCLSQGNEVAGDGIGEVKSSVIRVAAVDEHLPESLRQACVARMLVEANSVADGPALQHHRDGIGEVKSSVIRVAAVDEHLPESLRQACVARMLVEANSVADGPALQHHRHPAAPHLRQDPRLGNPWTCYSRMRLPLADLPVRLSSHFSRAEVAIFLLQNSISGGT
nr:hypothetical protein Iba_chr05dCG0300 [Ipomoea batatas]